MTTEEAIKVLERYHRFNALMEILVETIDLEGGIQNVSDLARGIKYMNERMKEAQEVVQNTIQTKLPES